MRKRRFAIKSSIYKLGIVVPALVWFAACKANSPSHTEEKIADETKKVTIGGTEWTNPIPGSPESVKNGAAHFHHHCQVCHGLDGQNTGVPFAGKMSPPVANLATKDVQDYADGQLKWIIQNGIRYSGMPGWNGILDDEEMWNIVNYLRHLPPEGSLGVPEVFKESESEHEGQVKSESGRSPHRH